MCQWLWDAFGVRIAKPTLSREVRALGCRKLMARPRHHAQAEGAIEALLNPQEKVWEFMRENWLSNQV